MPIDVKKFAQELAQQAGVAETDLAPLLKVLENDKFAKGLEDRVLAKSDYSRAMDQLRSQEAEFQRQQGEWKTWYDGVSAEDTRRQAALNAYKTRFGDIAQPNTIVTPPTIDPSRYISKEDYEKGLKDAQDKAVGIGVSITKEAIRASSHYQRTFGKELDMDALESYALKAGKPLRDAYKDFIADEQKAKTEADQVAATRKAVDEAVAAYASKHNLPTEGARTEGHVLFDRLKQPPTEQPLDERTRAQNFRAEWDKAASA